MASPRRHHQHVADEHAATPIHKSTTHTDPTCNCLPHCNCLLAAAPRAGQRVLARAGTDAPTLLARLSDSALCS